MSVRVRFPSEAHESLLEEILRGIFVFVHSLQFHLKRHIDDVIIVCSSVIFALVIMIGLADIFGNQSQVIKKLDVEAGVPAGLLEPGETVL